MKKMNEWRTRFEEQRRSGETIAAYCRRVGVSKSSFEYWRRKSEREEGRFVRVGGDTTQTRISVEVPGVATICLSDISQLRDVLEVLHARA